jgi:hypothetical protein
VTCLGALAPAGERDRRELGSGATELARRRVRAAEEDEQGRRPAMDEAIRLEDADAWREAFERSGDAVDAGRPRQSAHPLRWVLLEADLELQRDSTWRQARDRAVRQAHAAVAPADRCRPAGSGGAHDRPAARTGLNPASPDVPARGVRCGCERSCTEECRDHVVSTLAGTEKVLAISATDPDRSLMTRA